MNLRDLSERWKPQWSQPKRFSEIIFKVDQGFQTRTVQRTGEGRGSRFLRSNRDDIKINLILIKIQINVLNV